MSMRFGRVIRGYLCLRSMKARCESHFELHPTSPLAAVATWGPNTTLVPTMMPFLAFSFHLREEFCPCNIDP
jgi:hypothetical protein